MKDIIYLVVDLFCGAGGTSTGFEQATFKGRKIAEVVACVNHDPLAIASHSANHKDVHHFIEDIRTLEVSQLVVLVNERKRHYTSRGYEVKIILWASLECTNFSNAKGGKPRDADSRTLAEHLYRYVDAIDPDFVKIENVREFMAWGPLDKHGKPESRTKGRDYLRWVDTIKSFGYEYDFRLLNSADHGAHTSRVRYFGIFAKHGEPIVFPLATHAKNPGKVKDIFNSVNLKKWKPVKEVLDFDDEGKTIFNRKKALSEKTLARIYAGLVKYVAGGKEAFITQWHYNSHPQSINDPSVTVTTHDKLGIVAPKFLMQNYSGDPDSKVTSIENPSRVLTATAGNLNLVQPDFIAKYHGQGENLLSVDGPASTISTKDRLALIQTTSIDRQSFLMNTNFSNVGKSVNDPAMTLVASRRHQYLVNPQWGGHPASVDDPCFTIIARMDKAPPYLVVTESGNLAIAIEDGDSEYTIKIKEFMALYGIIDIKMRMLKVPELLKIQGFPDGYVLKGNETDKKRFIGNSVVPIIPRRWVEAMYMDYVGATKELEAA